MAVNFWTKEEIKTLRKLWSRGDTAAEIAKIIGRPRNAIIGQAHRLGLEKRQSPIIKHPEQIGSKRAPNTSKVLRDKTREKINQTAYGTPKTLIELHALECHWPINEGKNMLFCGAKSTCGLYCEKHYTISRKGKMHVEKYIQSHRK